MDMKYKIINTTVRPVRRNSRGEDTRKTLERNGHLVRFEDSTGKWYVLAPNEKRLVPGITPGMLGLQRGGYIKIEKVEDTAEVLKDHIYKPEPTAEEPRKEPAKKAQATEMGLDSYKQVSGSEYEGAVNPDGDPNFLVKAKRKKNATTTRSDQTDGEGGEVSSPLLEGHSSAQ